MKSTDFVVTARPRLAVINRFPVVEFADYERRLAEMQVVPANNKPFGRLAAFRIITDRLSKGVGLEPRAIDRKVAEAAEQLLGIRLLPGNHRDH